MRKTVCVRTNPQKVEELIRAGGGVQTPLDGDNCPACNQTWDRSHMLMIYDGEEQQPFKHCDDYIDDETQPAPLRAFLARAREPAHGLLSQEPFPKLFADFKGARYRVVMASRMGDVGITTQLERDYGYEKRCAVEELSNFRETP